MNILNSRFLYPIKLFFLLIRPLVYYGNKYTCPVCLGSFRKFIISSKVDTQCPKCGALQRHRLTWVFLNKRTELFFNKEKTFLHFAPERCFKNRFKNIENIKYISGDLNSFYADEVIDITDIKYPDNYFDYVYCSHVLEHVVDDKKALWEIFRVLKPSAKAIIQIPIVTENTFEDKTATTDEQRLKLFGQKDHVRNCGKDYIDRIKNTGFLINVIHRNDLLDEQSCVKMGIEKPAGEIFLCTKPLCNTK